MSGFWLSLEIALSVKQVKLWVSALLTPACLEPISFKSLEGILHLMPMYPSCPEERLSAFDVVRVHGRSGSLLFNAVEISGPEASV